MLVQGKYHWPTLKRDVKAYVLSCTCRRRKRQWSKQIAMLPARLLQPWEVLEIDIQDMKVTSKEGNRYVLVIVDRASKFLVAYALPSKEALGVSQKLFQLLLMFGLPMSIRCDAGGEFTAAVTQHLFRWLKVSLDFGPANHPRAQGAVERLGGWLQDILSYLCGAWPQRWCQYVPVATSIHRVTPDPSLPGGITPFKMLFGRNPRTPLDDIAPDLDRPAFGEGLERTVADRKQMFNEVQRALVARQETKNLQRHRLNARAQRTSPGAKSSVGDKVLVREASNTLHNDGIHPKLARDHFTGPWEVMQIVRPGLSFSVRLNGRRVRQRTVAASDIKPFHPRPPGLQHAFEDEFAHFVWSADLGLKDHSTAAVPLYTLTNRRVVGGAEKDPTSWAWEYQGRYHDGVVSPWLTEDEAKDSFSPLQLDVFHASWETYHGPDKAARPPGAPSRGEREVSSRTDALHEYPIGTPVGREFGDRKGNLKLCIGEVCDFSDPYWRVAYPDGDWEELTRRELIHATDLVKPPVATPN